MEMASKQAARGRGICISRDVVGYAVEEWTIGPVRTGLGVKRCSSSRSGQRKTIGQRQLIGRAGCASAIAALPDRDGPGCSAAQSPAISPWPFPSLARCSPIVPLPPGRNPCRTVAISLPRRLIWTRRALAPADSTGRGAVAFGWQSFAPTSQPAPAQPWEGEGAHFSRPDPPPVESPAHIHIAK